MSQLRQRSTLRSLLAHQHVTSWTQRLAITSFKTLIVTSLVLSGCVDPVTLTDGAGESAGEVAGPTVSGQTAGSTIPTAAGGGAGVTAGMTAGTTAGMTAGTTAGTTAGMTAGMTGGEMSGGDDGSPCNIGESLGLCIECGPRNSRITPASDDRCEPIDCDAYRLYKVINDEGTVKCREQTHVNGPSICQGPETCIVDPSVYCEPAEVEFILTDEEIPECTLIGGCSEEEGPFELIDEGAPCRDGAGVCDADGECVIESCAGLFEWEYNDGNILCEDRIDQGYCEFLVNSGDNPWRNGELNCREFCEESGGSCIGAWGEQDNRCVKLDSKGCDERFNDTICRCAPP